MKIQKTTIYAHINKEILHEKAKELKLSDKATDFFIHFNEVKLDIKINTETGEVISHKVKQYYGGKDYLINEN